MESLEMQNVKGEAKQLLLSTYNTTLDGLRLAMALVVALAWFYLVKDTVKVLYPDRKRSGLLLFFVFALVMTLAYVVLTALIKRFPWKSPSGLPVIFSFAN